MSQKDFVHSSYRSHTCAELRAADVGKTATLSGWIHRVRNHGGLVFVDLRDHYGLTQVVFAGDQIAEIEALRVESVIEISGQVLKRSAETINPKLDTGEIEVAAKTLKVHSRAEVLPFQIAEDDGAPEPTRLKYRFLELRREKLHRNIILRAKVISAIRQIMEQMGFLEFQTPILTSSSPEGARDFIVPSRLHPGKFYALPQAPQQFKQLLMVAGFDRYFQIAPCFRDEDARADRSPGEFYQLDLEMSFVEEEDVFRMFETLFTSLFERFSKRPFASSPFVRIQYDQSLRRFGSDKPDLRNPLEITDLSQCFADTEFRVFKEILAKGGGLYGLKLDLPSAPPRKYFDDMVDWFTKLAGQGVAYLTFEGAEFKGSIGKFVTPDQATRLRETLKTGACSVVFIAAGMPKQILPHVGKLRDKLGQDFNLINKEQWAVCWITDFPMYEIEESSGELQFAHNPFSMPRGGLDALLNKDPLEIYCSQYDLVINGYEILSGAIRNHEPEIMYKAFEKVGHSRADVDEKFGGMIRAFKFGAPPHGGGAPGIDRIVMLLAEEFAIRDVTAFPLAQNGEDLLMGAPSTVSAKQLREVHIELKLPPKS
ncbi:MAG: aspartate--tRNA ligase [Oligoflexia bacterium]|nr:aspartate--tRNA ligase [Oligoflexia bacterium]